MKNIENISALGCYSITMTEYRKQQAAREWRMATVTLRRLLGRLVTPNSAVSIFAALGVTGVAVQMYA